MKSPILFLTFFLVHTFAFGQGFVVRDFTADIYLNAEGYFDVVEHYDIEFTEAKHGIFRDIITDYTLQTPAGKTEKRKIVIQNLEVPGHPSAISSALEQRMTGKISVKIGDKDKLVTGHQHYEINYRVYNAFLFTDSLVQFYWNVKPSGWSAVFQKITFNVHAPEDIGLSAQNCFAYAGNEGVTTPSDDFTYSYSDGIFSGESKELFRSMPGQHVTLLMHMPRSAIQEHVITVPFWKAYGWIGILLLMLGGFWRLWAKYGKDDRVVATTSYYPPEGVDPAMAGYLINDKDDATDLIALIPHWASQGLITIAEIPKRNFLSKADMKLTKVKDLPENVPKYEQKLFDGLFTGSDVPDTVLVSSLRDTFYVTMAAARKDLKRNAQKYYEALSNRVMKITMVGAILLSLLLCPLFLFVWGVVAAVSAAVACIFIALMSFYLRKKNTKGNAVFSELKGFRQFIKVAEVNRIEMLLTADPHYFEKTMSYALTFGMLEKWGKKFDALGIAPPDWYSSGSTGHMGMHAFSRSFSSSMAKAQSNMVSSPSSSSSSGGGSSGGGFGGGGGGSW